MSRFSTSWRKVWRARMQTWTETSKQSTGISWSKSTLISYEISRLPGKRWRARGCQMTMCWRQTPGIASWSTSYRWVHLQRENILVLHPIINYTQERWPESDPGRWRLGCDRRWGEIVNYDCICSIVKCCPPGDLHRSLEQGTDHRRECDQQVS